jgi:hypothetical protein
MPAARDPRRTGCGAFMGRAIVQSNVRAVVRQLKDAVETGTIPIVG